MIILSKKLSFIFPLILLSFLFIGSGAVVAEEAVPSHEVAAEGAHSVSTEVKDVAEHAVKAVEHEAEAVGHEAHEAVHEHHGEGHEHHGITHSQLMNFIWHCLNFTLLIIILVKLIQK